MIDPEGAPRIKFVWRHLRATQVMESANTTEASTYETVGNRLSSLAMFPYTYNDSNQLTLTPNEATQCTLPAKYSLQ